MVYILLLLLGQLCLSFKAKSTAIFLRIEVCCVLDFNFFAHLVFDVVPVFGFYLAENLGIIAPVDALILLLPFDRYFLEVLEPMTIEILIKGNSLTQLL